MVSTGFPASNSRLLRTTAVLLLLGLVTAAIWVVVVDGTALWGALRGARLLPGLVLIPLTGLSIFGRFVRWQFLLRRAGVRIPARSSLRVYLASLAAVATPAHVGELVRSVLLRRRYRVPLQATLPVLVLERLLDALVLALVGVATAGVGSRPTLLAFVGVATIGIGLLGAMAWADVPRVGPIVRRLTQPGALLPAFLLSLFAWVPVMLSVGVAAMALDASVPWRIGASAFASGTLLGGVSLMPAGVITTGSLMILQLQASGLSLAAAVAVTSLVRAGTVGLTLLASLPLLLAELRSRGEDGVGDSVDHFEEIADEYGANFSPHIWGLLVDRKVDMLRRALAPRETEGLRGLDLGCGHGHHCRALRGAGVRVVGVDPAVRSAQHAGRLAVPVAAADGLALPFPDQSFDFVYAIGVIHHIDPRDRCRVMAEIRRVLSPGGCFLLHETNPRNPLFRFYMGYLFPVLKQIDEGTEQWLEPDELAGSEMRLARVEYSTFLPDFTPRIMLPTLRKVERRLERSRFKAFSAHYLAVLEVVG